VANILLCFELVRGLAMLTLTGCLMVTGTIVYHAMQPTRPLVIRFEDGLLIPVYGWAFWLDFAAGHSSVQIYYTTHRRIAGGAAPPSCCRSRKFLGVGQKFS